jgi:transcription elongation factor GreA
MARAETHLTPEGREALQGELDQLSSVRRGEVDGRIHKASETGGTVDNAEYEEAKNEQAFVEGRISELEQILFDAVVAIDTGRKKKRSGAVEFGSSVTVTTDKGKKRLYKVVGSAETAPLEGKISESSPVGSALMGHKKGDKVDVETPAGLVKLKITKVT